MSVPSENDERLPDNPAMRDSPRRKNGIATAALVLGLLSFCGGVSGIAGIICGIVGLARAKESGVGRGAASFGITASILGIVVSMGLLAFGIVYGLGKTREAAVRMKGADNLKQLGLGSHAYNMAVGHFMAPHADQRQFGKDIPVSRRLSWRIDVLPYIEQTAIYNRISRDEPWDSPANLQYSNTVVPQFSSPDDKLDPATRYRVFYGNGAAFEIDRPIRMAEFTDGLSNTFLIVEAEEKVAWPRFQELPYDPAAPLPKLGRANVPVFQALMGDGSVRNIRKTINPGGMRAAITRNGGEPSPELDP
jgi:hypothetical protein